MKHKHEVLRIAHDDKLETISRGISELCLQKDAKSLAAPELDAAKETLTVCRSLQDNIARTQAILKELQFEMRPVRHRSEADSDSSE
jgi:hypothetical protein